MDKQTITMEMNLNRVEGDLEIKLHVEDNTVTDAWCIGRMYRGYEQILVGRDPNDALVITPRICGICSTSQLYAATKCPGGRLPIPNRAQRYPNPQSLPDGRISHE